MRYADGEPPLTADERLQIAAVLMLWTFNPKTSADSRRKAERHDGVRKSARDPLRHDVPHTKPHR
jgi:hypothetical protein